MSESIESSIRELDIDVLPEDPVIPNQKCVVLSYAFSSELDRNGHRLPMIKIRGSYPDWESCDKRIKRLDGISDDVKSIPMIKTEVGKWVGLYPYEELYKNNQIDIEYKESFMNEAMGGLRQAQEKNEDQFFDRVKKDTEIIKKNGTKEGQEKLASEKEHPLSVYSRYETFKHSVDVLKEKLKEAEENMRKTEEKLKEYSTEEIEEVQRQLKESSESKSSE